MRTKLILLFCLFSFSIFGQVIPESKVPKVVVKNFQRKNSRASNVSWERKDINFLVVFVNMEKDCEAEFDKDGKLLMKKISVDPNDLMPSIRDYIKDNYKGYKYEYAELVEKGRERYFSVFIYPKKSKDEPPLTQVRFASTGKFLTVLDENGNEIKEETEDGDNENEEIEIVEETPKEKGIIPESKVPEIVVKDFKRKLSKATNVYWQKKNYDFLAKYKINGLKGQILYDRDGVLKIYREEKSLEKIHPQIQKYISENYKSHKYDKIEFVQEGRKEKYYSVIIYEKKKKKDEPVYTEVQFTTAGRYLTTYEPEIEYEDDDEDIWADDKFAEKADEDLDELKEVKEQNISKRELPSVALDYLNENFDNDWNWKELMIKNHKKYGNVYYVLLKREGQKLSIEHYFDINGELLERNEL